MTVSIVHPEYALNLPLVETTRTAVRGQKAIKDEGIKYLPADFAKDDQDRYLVYKERAYFIGATRQAEKSYVGMIFRRPANEGDGLPNQIKDIESNIDGCGGSLEQLAKYGATELMETGRFGLLADFPSVDGTLTAERERLLGVQPYITGYKYESIINWKTEAINNCQMLTLVVLEELIDAAEDEFGHEVQSQYRVLRLRDDGYTQQIYDDGGMALGDEFYPLMSGGERFNHIPFYITGSDDNRPDVDYPMLLDLAYMNISHYQSTANVEEAAYILGCPTLHVDIGETGTEDWKKLNPNGIKVGARTGVQTQGGRLEMVQASESSLGADQMEKKIQRMKELGAKLVTDSGQNETAEAARINASSESSALDTMVNNLSDSLENALRDVGLFLGIDEDINYRLNTDFWEGSLDSGTISAITGLVSTQSISNYDVRHMLRQGKIEIEEGRTNDDIDKDIADTVGNFAISEDVVQ